VPTRRAAPIKNCRSGSKICPNLKRAPNEATTENNEHGPLEHLARQNSALPLDLSNAAFLTCDNDLCAVDAMTAMSKDVQKIGLEGPTN
jgi:hypothetical protein